MHYQLKPHVRQYARKRIGLHLDCVTEMLRDGVIEPSISSWASPITLVPKKNNDGVRFCVNYQALNAHTEKDRYPLPNITDILDLLGGNKMFSTLDLRSGFWQLPVRKDDQAKTAFTCHMGLFQCKRIPFGLCNAPAFFQRTMDKVLTGLIGVSVFVYLDDIIIFSKNTVDHIKHIQNVFNRIRDAGLRLNPNRCSFGLEEVKLLGYIVNGQGIKTDPEKVKAISHDSSERRTRRP